MSEKVRFEEKEMMETSANWPNWPFLPIKKSDPKGGMPDCAVLYDDAGYSTTVFKINMWDIKTRNDLLRSEKIKYNSIDELLDAGWVVD